MAVVADSVSRTASLSTVQVAVVLAVVLAAGGVGAVVLEDVVAPEDAAPTTTDDMTDAPDVSTFASAEEFRSYLRATDRPNRAFRGDEVSREVETVDADEG